MRPIRVLHPITRLIVGGAQENTMLTADLLNRDPAYAGRYQVDVVCGPQTGPEGSLIEEVRRRGVSVDILPELRREVSPARDLMALIKLRRMMKARGYDIVHTHSSKAGVLGRIAARWAGVPLVVHTVHGWSFHDRMSGSQLRLYTALERLAARFGDRMIVVTERDIAKGLAQGIGRSAADFSLIRSGIELDRFGQPRVAAPEVRAALGVPVDGLVVGSVTRLSPQKAPMDLIDSFARVHKQMPRVYLVVVGDGPLRAAVETRIKELGLGEQVILTGLRRDVPELMAAFDLFVLTSLWEGLPRVLPQAMASGLAVVCTEADGSAEAIVEGENGYLVARGDTGAMASRILTMLGDEPMRRKMGGKGRSMAGKFGARKMVRDIDALYMQMLAGKR